MTKQDDFFGAAQASLFGTGEGRMSAPQQNTRPDPDAIRQRLQDLLQKAQAAQAMPWPERDARMWQTVFPNMAKWLPSEEAKQLCFSFEQEMQRLARAA